MQSNPQTEVTTFGRAVPMQQSAWPSYYSSGPMGLPPRIDAVASGLEAAGAPNAEAESLLPAADMRRLRDSLRAAQAAFAGSLDRYLEL